MIVSEKLGIRGSDLANPSCCRRWSSDPLITLITLSAFGLLPCVMLNYTYQGIARKLTSSCSQLVCFLPPLTIDMSK
jgi:hypothetical protein